MGYDFGVCWKSIPASNNRCSSSCNAAVFGSSDNSKDKPASKYNGQSKRPDEPLLVLTLRISTSGEKPTTHYLVSPHTILTKAIRQVARRVANLHFLHMAEVYWAGVLTLAEAFAAQHI